MLKISQVINDTQAIGPVIETDLVAFYDQKYPRAGGVVGGLQVIDDVPNTESIGSSFEEYEVLRGYRELSLSEFEYDPKTFYYAKNDFERSRGIAEQIKSSGKIKPLIIAVDQEGPWILEGAHRFLALHYLGVQSFPALVVVDLDQDVLEK